MLCRIDRLEVEMKTSRGWLVLAEHRAHATSWRPVVTTGLRASSKHINQHSVDAKSRRCKGRRLTYSQWDTRVSRRAFSPCRIVAFRPGAVAQHRSSGRGTGFGSTRCGYRGRGYRIGAFAISGAIVTPNPISAPKPCRCSSRAQPRALQRKVSAHDHMRKAQPVDDHLLCKARRLRLDKCIEPSSYSAVARRSFAAGVRGLCPIRRKGGPSWGEIFARVAARM